MTTITGLLIVPEHGLDRLATADLVVVTSWDHDDEPSAELQDSLRAAVDRGARLLAHCTGAFAVAATGLLAERRATTHWRYVDAFARRYPQVELGSRRAVRGRRSGGEQRRDRRRHRRVAVPAAAGVWQ